MLSCTVPKRLLVTLAIFTIIIIPNWISPIYASRSGPIAFFAPSPSMPLPSPKMPPGYVVQPAPASGVLRILVIASYFSDINYTVSIASLNQEFFGQTNSWYAYYQEISYGSITLKGDVIGWYKLPYPEAHYGADCTLN